MGDKIIQTSLSLTLFKIKCQEFISAYAPLVLGGVTDDLQGSNSTLQCLRDWSMDENHTAADRAWHQPPVTGGEVARALRLFGFRQGGDFILRFVSYNHSLALVILVGPGEYVKGQLSWEIIKIYWATYHLHAVDQGSSAPWCPGSRNWSLRATDHRYCIAQSSAHTHTPHSRGAYLKVLQKKEGNFTCKLHPLSYPNTWKKKEEKIVNGQDHWRKTSYLSVLGIHKLFTIHPHSV